jgi:hypothetical protein
MEDYRTCRGFVARARSDFARIIVRGRGVHTCVEFEIEED